MTRLRVLALLTTIAFAASDECVDNELWHHKQRGEDYDCEWVSAYTKMRCHVNGILVGDDATTVVAKDACMKSCSPSCALDPEMENVVFVHDSVLDDFLGETLLMDAHRAGEINFLGSMVVNADSVLPSSMDLVYKFRELHGTKDPFVGLSSSRMFNAFPWDYRRDSYSMDNLDVMQAVETEIPAVYPEANAWLEGILEDAPEASITLMYVAGATPIHEIFMKKPELAGKIKKMIWMAGAIDVHGNLESRHFEGFAKCTEDMGWCEPSEFSFAEWNIFVDPYATDYIFRETTFPIYMVPLDVCDKLPIPGTFMETLYAADSEECNEGIYQALVASYDRFAAPQPFYKLWDSGAVMYYLDPTGFGEPELTEVCVGTSWDYLGGLFRKENVDKDEPACDLLVQEGTCACRELYLVLTLATNDAGDEDPQQVFDFGAKGACAAGTG